MTNLTYHQQSVSLADRETKNSHKAVVLWFTGLSGSGKSSLAMALQEYLFEQKYQVTTLDGDNVRQGLNSDLGFSDSDRIENLRRVAEVSKLFAQSGFIVLTSFISPFKQERERAKKIIQPIKFFEIYIEVDLETAESRDPKGLYKKARSGEIKNFTGLDSPYEVPSNPDLVISNSTQDVKSGVNQLVAFLKEQQII